MKQPTFLGFNDQKAPRRTSEFVPIGQIGQAVDFGGGLRTYLDEVSFTASAPVAPAIDTTLSPASDD
jgi:hypothetical protein